MKSESDNPNAGQVESIFTAALAFPGAERAAYLSGACGSDAKLRERIEALLRAHEQAGGFLPEQAATSARPALLVVPPSGSQGTEPAEDGTIDSLTAAHLPLIFHRSPLAWDTHPQNYRDIEGMVTTVVGRHLFGMELDYAWCHMAASAGDLRRVISLTTHPGISMVAEIVYHLQENIHTKEVDWLAWEDPFIFGCDAAELKREREKSVAESQRRLAYAIPMIEFLTQQSKNGRMK